MRFLEGGCILAPPAGCRKQQQSTGELDPSLSPDAVAHFCLLLGMGSALIPPDLHAVDDDEWAALLSRVVRALTADAATPQTRTETGSATCQT